MSAVVRISDSTRKLRDVAEGPTGEVAPTRDEAIGVSFSQSCKRNTPTFRKIKGSDCALGAEQSEINRRWCGSLSALAEGTQARGAIL